MGDKNPKSKMKHEKQKSLSREKEQKRMQIMRDAKSVHFDKPSK
jgi:hypothetical protein